MPVESDAVMINFVTNIVMNDDTNTSEERKYFHHTETRSIQVKTFGQILKIFAVANIQD